MAVRSTTVTAPSGVVFIEERDADTNALLRHVAVTDDQQPLKVRRLMELKARVQDWFLFSQFVDEAAARGKPAGAITIMRTMETHMFDAAWDAGVEWNNT